MAFGKLAGGGRWVRPGWAVPALAAASPLCHLSRFSPHPFSLSFSLSFIHSKTKEESRVLIRHTPSLYQTPSPPSHNSPHYTTTKPSVLSAPGSVTFFHSPLPSHQNGCNIFKNIYIYIFKSNFFFGDVLSFCIWVLGANVCGRQWGDPVLSWCP